MNPAISVVMSIYNEPAEWIRQSIDSILDQTFENFEFIIINDYPESVRNIDLLNLYSFKDSRVKPIFNSQNIGLTKSLNRGLKEAKGEFVARMDADDIAPSDRFDCQYRVMKSNVNIVACGSWVRYFGDKSGLKKYPISNDDISKQMLYDSPICHPSSFIRAKTLRDNSLEYKETLKRSQDYRLWYDLMQLGDLYNIPKVLLKYRFSNSQVSSRNKEEQQLDARNTRRLIIQDYFIKYHQLHIIDFEIGDLIDKLENTPSRDTYQEQALYILYGSIKNRKFHFLLRFILGLRFRHQTAKRNIKLIAHLIGLRKSSEVI